MQACLGKRAEVDREFNILNPPDYRLRKKRSVTTAAHTVRYSTSTARVGESRACQPFATVPSKWSKSKDKIRIKNSEV